MQRPTRGTHLQVTWVLGAASGRGHAFSRFYAASNSLKGVAGENPTPSLLAAPALSARVYVGRLRMSRAWWGRNVLLLLLAAPALSASVHVGRMAPKIKLTYFNIEGVAEVSQGPSPRAQILQNCTLYALLTLSGRGRCPACVCAAHAHLVCKRTFSHS